MGMNRAQLLLRVILPLALPVIVAGLRVATVTTIGIATIAPWVSVHDVGSLIFEGYSDSYYDQVTAGVILVSLLAILADLSLLALERWLSRGRQGVAVA
jgi:osmoprotectant transport system permease protein